MREGDLQFAESAIAGDMKLLEGVVDSDPTNVKYLQLACMGYTSYALAFAEDDPARALLFYTRAQEYGARGLELRGIPKGAFTADAATMRAALRKLQKGDVPAGLLDRQLRGGARSAFSRMSPTRSRASRRRTP